VIAIDHIEEYDVSELPPPTPHVSATPTNRSTKSWFIPIAALLVGIGTGFALGRSTSNERVANQELPSATINATVPTSSATDETTNAPDTDPRVTVITAAPSTNPPVTTAPSVGVTPSAPNASPYVKAFGGAETISLPPGEPGQVSVIALGSLGGAGNGTLPVVVRNMTNRTIDRVRLNGIARDSSGALAGSGEDQGVDPALIAPGEIAWGYVYFGSDLPQGSTFEVTAKGEPHKSGGTPFGSVPLKITELNPTKDAIVGIATNDGTAKVSGPIGVSVLCLAQDGSVLSVKNGFAGLDSVEPGATSPFTISFYSDPVCGQFLIAASGYSF
jgi:hypothetical protein